MSKIRGARSAEKNQPEPRALRRRTASRPLCCPGTRRDPPCCSWCPLQHMYNHDQAPSLDDYLHARPRDRPAAPCNSGRVGPRPDRGGHRAHPGPAVLCQNVDGLNNITDFHALIQRVKALHRTRSYRDSAWYLYVSVPGESLAPCCANENSPPRACGPRANGMHAHMPVSIE